jgi:hypothetical protein
MTLQLIVLAVEIVALIWMIPILIKVNKIDRDLKAMNDRLGVRNERFKQRYV